MPKKTILLVEDERTTAVLEAKMLRKAGYDVICECCGEDAIDRVNKTPGIDLILMDIDLGAGVDGTAAAEMILKSNDVPVVFLSAHTEPEVVEKTENITSYGYVVKYTGETVLLASLKMAFKLHLAHNELNKNRLELADALGEQRRAEKVILQQKSELEKTNEELLRTNQELTAANEEFEAMNEELVRSQDELIRSEMKFKGVVENSPSGIHLYELTSEGSLVFTGANKSADRILGVDNSMFIGKTIEDAFPPLAGTGVPEAYKRVAREGGAWRTEQVNFEDGIISGAYEVMAFQISKNRMAASFRDITENKRIMQRLEKSEALFNGLVQTSPLPILMVRKENEGKIETMNSKFTELFGYSADDIYDMKSWWSRAFPNAEYRSRIQEIWIAAVEDAEKPERKYFSPFETRILAKDGCEHFINVHLNFYEDRAMVVFNDLTEKKRLEQSLMEKEERYRGIFDHIQNPMGAYRAINDGGDFIIIDYNRAAELMSGISRDQVIGKRLLEMFPGMKDFGLISALQRVYRGGNPEEIGPSFVRGRSRDGWGKTFVYRLSSGELVSIYYDVTESNDLQEKLKKERDLVESLMETAPSGITVINRDGEIIFANIFAEKILGISRDAISSRKYNTPQWKITDFDGNPFPDERLPFVQVMKTGKAVCGVRHAIEHADGRRVLLSINAAPIFDESGEISMVIASLGDMTELMERERELQKSYTEKDVLLKELQHRIKNSFTIMSSMLQLEKENAVKDETRRVLGNIRDRISILAEFYRLLLQSNDILVIRLDEYLLVIADSLRALYLHGRAGIKFEISADEVAFDVRRAIPIGLILNELITNALKYAFPDGREGVIAIRLTKNETAIILEVADNGIGLSEAIDPLKTGSLGLKLVQILLEQTRGTMTITRDRGLRFTISLPIA